MAQIEGIKAAVETCKQVITLSTGVIALTVTFLKDVVDTKAVSGSRLVQLPLFSAWVLFAVAVLFAVITLMALTGTLTALDRAANGHSLTPPQQAVVDGSMDNVRRPALLMIGAFVLGLLLTIFTGFLL